MKTVKSELQGELCSLILLAFSKKSLKKVVLSKPDATDEIKSVISPKQISGNELLQIETFSKDNKAYHVNLRENLEKELLAIVSRYAQINVVTTSGDAQFMRSRSGKETLIGAQKIKAKLLSDDFNITCIQENNTKKNYILTGEEDFLKKLGVSDVNGRVRDKMQSKFRQINKFIEHIDAIKDKLPCDKINVYDLCCGKSYLSFAVYHYFKNVLKTEIKMVCVDLKADVIEYCTELASRIGFDKMEFVCGDINEYVMEEKPHLVISLHACDIATDIVLNKASDNGADVILSTPCCHHELNHSLNCKPLEFVAKHSMLRQKMCDALTDALRLMKLESEGYSVSALELIDPEDTPKNIMLRAIKKKSFDQEKAQNLKNEYEITRKFLLGK